MQNLLTSAINAALNLASVKPNNAPRFKLTDERIATLRKIHGTEAAFLMLAHNFYGAPNYRIQGVVEAQMRRWVPDELAAKWAERDARASLPVVNGVRFNPRNARQPFNTFRVAA